ncbi:MAG: phosphoribosyltransferase family protein [Cyclobacteriaceae bacterium]|nr:phosphoribosyltransferase family protein [Cyclobacteriaceae bacterium]
MTDPQKQILSAEKINKILRRIAIQIVENNYGQEKIVLVGVEGQGDQMAGIIQNEIVALGGSMQVERAMISIDKSRPVRSEITLNRPIEQLAGKPVIVVDDVMNTGRTQAYCLSFLMQVSMAKVETAVLVNRSHTRYPISATYSGFELSTTLDEHIEVRLESETGAYLY